MSLKEKGAKAFINLIGVKTAEKLIKLIAHKKGINLLLLAYRTVGIHNAGEDVSGENYFIKNKLPLLIKSKKPVLFDVGANLGNFSIVLRENIKNASIYAFEPCSGTFDTLQSNVKALNIVTEKAGLGSISEVKSIFYPKVSVSSPHATLYKNVINELLDQQEIVEEKVEIFTIDQYCLKNHIDYIDFLKIDTEGNELSVLQGAKNMLSLNKIGIVQFEFNEMNVVSRVFLKDFYELLPGFQFYRLNTNSLITLGKYTTFNEIPQFQNIVAIRDNA